jgi:hypothetical protein
MGGNLIHCNAGNLFRAWAATSSTLLHLQAAVPSP